MWLLIVALAKIAQFAVELSFSSTLIDVCIALLSGLNAYPDMKVFVVVIVVPTIMNVF
jgi:hypothetical protein